MFGEFRLKRKYDELENMDGISKILENLWNFTSDKILGDAGLKKIGISALGETSSSKGSLPAVLKRSNITALDAVRVR